MNRIASNRFLGIGDAPAAVVPIAKLQPANIAAARFAILWEVLRRPVASPILHSEIKSRRDGVREIHRNRVNFSRIIPHDALAVLQRSSKRRRVKRR